jgi:hypothetical protein
VLTDGQSSEEVAKVVMNLVIIGREAKKPSGLFFLSHLHPHLPQDVPFNIGTNRKTQVATSEALLSLIFPVGPA